MFQQRFWHSWFRVHFKTLLFNHNSSVILNFRKRVTRLLTTGAINVKKRPSEGGHIIGKRIPLTQVQILKSFNSLLIKFNVSTQETCCQNFFPAHCTCVNFFWDNSLVQEFFLTHMHSQDFVFQNHPTPLSEVKWLAPK